SASAQRLAATATKVSLHSFTLDNLAEACAGADGAFVVAPLSDEMEAWHRSVATALSAAGVSHVVKVSVTGARPPQSEPPPGRFPSLHFAGEEALRQAGLLTTVIRPTIFMQHFEMNTGLYTRSDDRVFLPTAAAGVAFLDCRDIASFGQELLLSPAAVSFRGGAYELTGPEALTGQRIAEILTNVRERPTTHVDGKEKFEARCAELGQPDWAKFVYAEAAEGWFSTLSTEPFEAVVGRKPRSFATYADDHALWFRP
ncbi:MAG: NmrA family NAD(P)-binding protein, partial [Myxococcota bacterium]